jgi:hypothetical protein
MMTNETNELAVKIANIYLDIDKKLKNELDRELAVMRSEEEEKDRKGIWLHLFYLKTQLFLHLLEFEELERQLAAAQQKADESKKQVDEAKTKVNNL